MEFRIEHIRGLDVILLINAITSTLPITIAIFFLLDDTISEEDVSLFFSIKFWGAFLFSFLFIPASKILDIKNIILLSIFIKLSGYLIFFIYPNLQGGIFLIIMNSLSSSLFSISSKIYIREVYGNISTELSKRFTINNIGVSVTPIFFIFFENINHLLIVVFILFIIMTPLLFTLRNGILSIVNEKKNEKLYLDAFMIFFILFSCILFSIFYFVYEKVIPIIISRGDDSIFYSFIVGLNTILIILFQVKTYGFLSNRMGVLNSFLTSFFICSVTYVTFVLYNKSYIFIIIFVLGITFLEMFFSTAIDSMILRKRDGSDKYYFIFFNVFIAIGITIAPKIVILEEYVIILCVLSLFIIIFFLSKKIVKN